MLFNRQKQCNHCGYLYCSTCTDYNALMPREHGYDTKPVCSFCIELLTITAAGKGALKSFQMAKLKKYLAAYNIRTDRVVEKDDLVNAILEARSPNGCLRREYEDYYRRHSVPDRTSGARPRGVFSRPTNAPPPPVDSRRTPVNNRTTFARPDLEPDPPHYASPSGPPPNSRPAPRQSHPPHTPPSSSQANSGQRPSSGSQNASPRPPPPPPQARPSPPPPPPTMEQLMEMTAEQVSSLSVSALKAVMFANHVNTGVGVLEKSELVNKVQSLIDDERRDRARREAEEQCERQREEARRTAHAEELRREQEEMDRVLAESLREHNESQRNTPQEERREDHSEARTATPPPSSPEPAASPSPPPKMTPAAQSMATQLERTGLCVICQDDEANIAIVDCGHLCLCRGCSNIVMGATRECPLCRTRIVTESRLLRIFRT